MGQRYDSIPDHLAAWMAEQPIWFVATAPLAADGHVNVSPKGEDTFRVIDERTVAYLDLTGSGAETAAHLRENGRLTIMFCSFDRAANIVRLYGRGEAITPDAAEFADLAERFPERLGTRAVIRLHVEAVTTSCGWGVPQMEVVGHRERLAPWAEGKGPDGLAAYQADRNAASIDGLPAYAD